MHFGFDYRALFQEAINSLPEDNEQKSVLQTLLARFGPSIFSSLDIKDGELQSFHIKVNQNSLPYVRTLLPNNSENQVGGYIEYVALSGNPKQSYIRQNEAAINEMKYEKGVGITMLAVNTSVNLEKFNTAFPSLRTFIMEGKEYVKVSSELIKRDGQKIAQTTE